MEGLEQRALMTGFWTQLQATNFLAGPTAGIQAPMLLSNGVVIAGQDTAPNTGFNGATGPTQTTWFQLNPTANGTYVNGTWGLQATMNTPRLFFPTQTLQDGRIFAIGGEFSPTVGFINAPEIYDPVTNKWTSVAPMPSPPTQVANFPSVPPTSPQSQFGDDPIAILPNGDILAGYFNGPQTFVYHPATNTWRQTTNTKLRNDQSDEEVWIKLPDGSVLSYDIFASINSNTFHAQRFVPSLDMWVDASNVDPLNKPVNLSSVALGSEMGPMMLLPDGRVILFGANGQTAYYNPTADIWSKGPDMPFDISSGFPRQLGGLDNPGAMLPNGKVLLALSPNFPALSSNPTRLFEFDPTTNVFTDVTPTPNAIFQFSNLQFHNAEDFEMLVLPTGQVLLCSLDVDTNSIFGGPDLIYTPDGLPKDAWRPTIKSIVDNKNGTFTLSGTQLNGISEGAYFGEDVQMSSNYPLLRMNDKSGNVVYARTFNWSETGVQTGTKPVTTQFTLPAGTKLTDFTNYTVVANGIPSLPFQFVPTTPQSISGTKFNDLNANGIRDAGEPGLSKVMIYVDLNNDGKVGITEPAAVTDFFGNYTIANLKPGNYIVREVPPASGVQTLPGPRATPVANAYSITIVDQSITGLDFGNSVALDFGDAPASYNTLLATDGARAYILPGFHLGALIDAEVDGNPSADATGDDGTPIPPNPLPTPPPPSPDDEDGIVFPSGGLAPGSTATIQVTVTTGSNYPGRLQGWIDFNRNGKFDANEKIISNLLLAGSATPYNLSFAVPSTAVIGTTFARFRYGYESDLGPSGLSQAGEVEDYQVTVLPSVPIANPDVFPLPGQPLIKQGAVDYPLDVLANDTPSTFGPVHIVPGSFPATLPSGSTLKLNAAGDRILYTPAATLTAPIQEQFTYRISDGKSISAPALVTVNVSLRDPVAVDDTFTLTVPPLTEPVNVQLAVMLNDLFPLSDTHIINVQPVTANPLTGLTIDPTNATLVDFLAPQGFRGTEEYQYTIDDSDPTTNPSTAFITIQVVDANATSQDLLNSGYLAELDVAILDPITGQPISAVNEGDQFLARVTSHDLRPGGNSTNRGVEAAYLDLLFNRNFVAPVADASNPKGFAITYDSNPPSPPAAPGTPTYTIQQLAFFNSPAPGEINEAGATHNSSVAGVGTGNVAVFTVLMQAIASTPVGSPLIIAGDPADLVDTTEVVIMPDDPAVDPSVVTLTEEQTFLRPSSPLTIMGAGEGEFVNRFNPLDVNEDNQVSPIDALTVINNLNATGSQALVDGANVNGMVDVNMDSQLSPIDALMVINFINGQHITLLASSGGEGEPSSSSSAFDADLAALSTPDTGSTSGTTATTNSTTTPALQTSSASVTSTSSSTTTTDATNTSPTSTTTTKVDTTAADQLYSSLGQSGGDRSIQRLRNLRR